MFSTQNFWFFCKCQLTKIHIEVLLDCCSVRLYEKKMIDIFDIIDLSMTHVYETLCKLLYHIYVMD